MGPENRLAAKYQGGSARVAQLAARLGEVARRNEAQYLDIHTPLQGSMSSISEDGVHLLAPAQQRVAEMIEARLKASEERQ
jgi:lysophospholipase L1-like esterase